MKLNSAQVEQTLSQFEAYVIPDDHPMVPKLNELFGGPHILPQQRGIECCRAERDGRAGRDNGKPCQLDRCKFDRSSASRVRADKNHRHA
jgi:hypothetical protein